MITQLICHFTLDIPALERAHGIVFADYFDTELAELAQMRAAAPARYSKEI